VRALGRSGEVHRDKVAFTTTLPAPRHVSNTIGEKSTPIRLQEFALSRNVCCPLYFKKAAALPRKVLPVTGVG